MADQSKEGEAKRTITIDSAQPQLLVLFDGPGSANMSLIITPVVSPWQLAALVAHLQELSRLQLTAFIVADEQRKAQATILTPDQLRAAENRRRSH